MGKIPYLFLAIVQELKTHTILDDKITGKLINYTLTHVKQLTWIRLNDYCFFIRGGKPKETGNPTYIIPNI